MKQKLNCVLLIDDDEPTNFLTQMILEDAGCANYIKVAQSGPEALKYLSSNAEESNPTPDLVFLDINMPAMDGWEFIDEFRNIGRKLKPIIIMLTTSLFPEDRQRAKEIPEISGFENKPLTEDKM